MRGQSKPLFRKISLQILKRLLLALIMAGVASVSFSGCIWVHGHHDDPDVQRDHMNDYDHDHAADSDHMDHHDDHPVGPP